MHLRLTRFPEIRRPEGGQVALASRDAALLAWLALEGPTARSRLALLLWPDSEPKAARNNLRQRVFQLKRWSGADVAVGTDILALGAGVVHDLDSSHALLGDDAHDHSPDFAAWLRDQRERRRAQWRQALVARADRAEQAHAHAEALQAALDILALEPLSEEAHRRLIRLHYLAGDRAAALLAFDRCEQVLKNEVGTRPSAQTMALLATIEGSAPQPAAPLPVARGGGPVPASVMRPPRLIGRERELAALNEGWRAGQVVALIGEAGMGKTRLLQALGESHAGVVRAAGRPGDAGVPFSTLARLLRAVLALRQGPPGAELAPPMRSEIGRVLPEFGGGPALASEGQRLVLQRALRALLAQHPELTGVALDDLHFADEASLDMLASLLEAEQAENPMQGDAAAPALRWVLAYRPAEAGSAVRSLQDALVEAARLAPVTVAPLNEAALAELVDSLGLAGLEGRKLAPGLARRTGGNPLFALETLKQAWVERSLHQLADANSLPRPVSVGLLIERRVAQLSPGALALARVASVAGVDFSVALAETVLGVSAMQFADALNELESAQVLRGNGFAHDLVFDAVRASVPTTIAAHTHAAVAAWLELRQSEPARIAEHWVQAGEGLRALPWLQKAADAARRALRSKEFIAFMERKSAIEEAAGHRAEAFDSLAVALAERVEVDSDAATVGAYCDRLAGLASTPAQQVEALLQRAGMHKQLADFSNTLHDSRLALRESIRLADPALTARCHMMLANAHGANAQDEQALSHLQASMDWVNTHGTERERSDLHGSMGVLYDNLARLDDALPHHELGFALACSSGNMANAAIACGNLACNRIDAGDLLAAEQNLQKGLQVAAQYDTFSATLGSLQLLRALSLCHLGHYDVALQQAEQGLESMRRHQPGHENIALLRLATCWWHLGQWSRMPKLLDAAQLDQGLGLSARVLHALLRWRYLRGTGAGAAAVALARKALQSLLGDIGPDKRPDMRLPLVIELTADLDPAAALAQLDAVCAEARRIGFMGALLAGHIRAAAAAAVCDPARAGHEAREALALAEGHQTTVLLPAELWLHAGQAILASGDREAAQAVMQQGRDWLQRTARDHVPGPFRDSFLQRNPVNRSLLASSASGVGLV